MDFRKVALGLALLSSTSFAAVWERPSGAYTPSNHSANITEFQDDSAAHRAISSAKVDGNLNKAFEGLNDIESRTPPSVTGNAGLFLTNDGAQAYWAEVTPTSVGLQAPSIFSVAGSPVTSSGTISITLNTQTSNTFLAGPLFGSNTVPTFRAISTSDVPFLVSQTSSGIVVNLPVSTTNVTVTNVTVGTISSTNMQVAKAAANIDGNGCSVRKQYNIASCTRVSQGVWGISFSTPMPDANYVIVGTCLRIPSSESWFEVTDQISSPTTTGFMVRCQGAGGVNDTGRLSVVVF
ncbi:hypothetical protein [Bradyrhizobium manausense]|uniref:hypothetical protein n=1 Tax=Bradyrhizobium manausense TaxID=989370 RepID=UPI001BA99025|nr:hypothetical protein [Bradyrhizobium manausense]MBR0721766.1 hypothetical protein [Bradyrhizobium manausense]